ncbi:MAG: hypothetical protein HY287_04015 [Planctomycetes bacterium]|nr:hypothetical protein [Planctomycetota bacterium]MBI3833479.1 hypothetical protein [Planctomycetota bacterium]
MGDLSARNFGLLIAYWIPGFIALAGVGMLSPPVAAWLSAEPGPSLGGFLYSTMASLAAGMTVSALRWAMIDTFHHCTGLIRPEWDDSRLTERLPALEYLVETHYRYYQFYGNSFVAMVFAYSAWRFSAVGKAVSCGLPDVGVAVLASVFLAGSRDTLRKYYCRATLLLGQQKGRRVVTNGGHHVSEEVKSTMTGIVKAERNTAMQDESKVRGTKKKQSTKQRESRVER